MIMLKIYNPFSFDGLAKGDRPRGYFAHLAARLTRKDYNSTLFDIAVQERDFFIAQAQLRARLTRQGLTSSFAYLFVEDDIEEP